MVATNTMSFVSLRSRFRSLVKVLRRNAKLFWPKKMKSRHLRFVFQGNRI